MEELSSRVCFLLRFQCLGVSQPRVASSSQPACDYRARPGYIIQALDETVAGEIEGITLTDRIPIIFFLPPETLTQPFRVLAGVY